MKFDADEVAIIARAAAKLPTDAHLLGFCREVSIAADVVGTNRLADLVERIRRTYDATLEFGEQP